MWRTILDAGDVRRGGSSWRRSDGASSDGKVRSGAQRKGGGATRPEISDDDIPFKTTEKKAKKTSRLKPATTDYTLTIALRSQHFNRTLHTGRYPA